MTEYTPERNSMQVKFLDKNYLENFCKYAFGLYYPNEQVEDGCVKHLDFEPEPYGDVAVGISRKDGYGSLVMVMMVVKLIPVIGGDFSSILRDMKKRDTTLGCIIYKRFACEGISLEDVKSIFQTCGILLIQESELP
jgi:hypothetical protein